MLRKILLWAFKKQLEEELNKANILIEQADSARIIASRRNFTTLEKCEVDSEHYLRTCKDIWETPAFQYELLNIKNVLVNSITDGKQESAVLIQGMFKGLDVVSASFQSRALKYYQLLEEKNAKIQSQGTQEETY